MHTSRGLRLSAVLAASLSVAFGLVGLTTAAASAAGSGAATDYPASYVPLRGHTSLVPGNTSLPGDNVFSNLDYNGGAVMPTNTDYLVFWSPSGFAAYGSSEYASGLEQYWKNLEHDSGMVTNTDSVSTQYSDATGASVHYNVSFGGALLDTDPYPTSMCPVNSPVTACLTDAQIQRELEKVVAANHLKTDLSHEYFLVTPPHVEGCSNKNATASPPYGGCSAGFVPASDALYCAYHQQTSTSPMLFYSDDPYVTGNAGCDDKNHPNGPSDGALEGGMSHEHNESITDPIPNDAWTNGAGANHGEEVGDQCDGHYGTPLGTAPDGAKYNQVINGHDYWYQEEWSNDTHQCLQRYTPPAILPVAKFTAKAGTGTSMTFDASASTAPGGVADYVWQFNAVNGAATVEQTTPTITYAFPTSGAYSVGLTVYTGSGLSGGAGHIITTGTNGPTAGFTSTPSGLSVTFQGLTAMSGLPVKNELWEFGDGTSGSGPAPTHVYATAGTYKVKVILFSGIGSAFPGAGAAPIFTAKVTVS